MPRAEAHGRDVQELVGAVIGVPAGVIMRQICRPMRSTLAQRILGRRSGDGPLAPGPFSGLPRPEGERLADSSGPRLADCSERD
eukprot:13007573-Heterocapsa_arctica.AAC.1